MENTQEKQEAPPPPPPPPPPPHILAIPFPFPAHITSLLHLCKILAASGFSITFLITQRNLSHLAKILPNYPLLYHRPLADIRFISVPDGLPFASSRSLDDFRQLLAAFEKLRWLVELLLEQQLISPPIACILSDVHMGWTQDVAYKLGVPRVAFWSSLAAECQVYCQSLRLIAEGYLPFKATTNRTSDDDTGNPIHVCCEERPLHHHVSSTNSFNKPIHIHGLPPLLRTEFPAFLQIEDCSDIIFQYFINQTKRIPEAYMVVVNSFLELETSVFTSLKAEGNVHPVGPLFSLREKVIQSLEENSSTSEDECIKWLDKQLDKSVVYVAFGSTFCLRPGHVTALATGLEASQQAFLWALLPDSISGQSPIFPEGFLDRTRGRGLVIDWSPQTLVLGRPSVGGFLCHCGWNSVLESISFGVPVIGFPLWGDHPLICKLMVEEWGVGMRLKKTDEGFPSSENVEKVTREVMEGEKGRELRKRCGEWSAASKRAVESGGSSRATLQDLVEKLKKSC